MKKAFVIIFIALWVAITAIAGAIIWGRAQLGGSLPLLSGIMTLDGLSEQVEIYRDEYGVPHIYAQNRHDLMFAVGFVSAQDRLWQMDLMRRAGTGRLAEIFGEEVLDSDLLARTLGLERIAKRQQETLSPRAVAALESFSGGVNACIEHMPALPPEFRLLKYRPERWQPSDTLAISRLLAWQLSKNFKSEIIMSRITAKLGAERAAELGPAYPLEGPFIIPAAVVEEPPKQSFLDEGAQLLDEIVGAPGGSNSWVIGSFLAKNHMPILANDPHLSGTRMPSIWYFVHLVGDGFDVIGSIIPGTPFPALGHNRRIGWGMTNMNADVQDLFIERINPNDPNVYEYDGKWVEMDTRVEQISFRTKELETFFIKKQVRNTIHGPVMNDVAPEVPEAISLNWTGLEPTQDLESLYDLNLAGNWLEFTRALSTFGVAPQNFVYADVDGNIGYYGAGIIPVRQSGSGIMPQKGWLRESTWKGRIPFYEMPHVFNPPASYIVTANNRVAGDEYGHFLSAEWAPSFRYQRIAELIESENAHDEKSMARIQSDTKSLLARLLCKEVMPALADLSDPQLRDAVARLQTWDFDSTTDSVAATIYHEFLIRFARNTFIDEMGEELAGKYLDNYYLWIERFVAFAQQGSRWFDNVRTEQVETRDDIAAESFKEAIASLRERLGENMSRWRWGLVHTVEFRHPLDDNRLVRRIFNWGPFPFPGDGESVNRGAFGFTAPYSMTMAASLRHIMNFSRLRETLAIHTTGQSANPLSSHYHDFGDRWLKGEYAIMMMDRHDFISGAEGRLILTPAGRSSVESAPRR